MKNLPASLVAWRGPAAAFLALLIFRPPLGGVLLKSGWPVARRGGPGLPLAALLLLLTPLAGAPTGISSLRSQLKIDVGQQVELGGNQRRGFRLAVRNVGPVAVEIREKTANGRLETKATLQPGQETTAAFGLRSKAILVNLGQQEAKIDGDICPSPGLDLPRVSGPDFSAASAPDWHGTLTYLDYGTQKSVTLITDLRGQMSGADRLILKFDYEEPNKTHVFDTDTLAIAPGGARVRWDGTTFTVQTKQWLPNHTLHLVLEGSGQDNLRPVLIRKTVLLNAHLFSVRKQVRLAADTAFIQRNAYRFTR